MPLSILVLLSVAPSVSLLIILLACAHKSKKKASPTGGERLSSDRRTTPRDRPDAAKLSPPIKSSDEDDEVKRDKPKASPKPDTPPETKTKTKNKEKCVVKPKSLSSSSNDRLPAVPRLTGSEQHSQRSAVTDNTMRDITSLGREGGGKRLPTVYKRMMRAGKKETAAADDGNLEDDASQKSETIKK